MTKPRLIESPTQIEAAGNKVKIIQEFIGRVNTGTEETSIAVMHSPGGWEEEGQRPSFDEFSVVLDGLLRVEFEGGYIDATPGQAVHAPAGVWVRYSTPAESGAKYLAVCLPAFSPDTVHRDPT